MATGHKPTTGFSDAADWPASARPIDSTSPNWTQPAPLPANYEAYEAAFEATERDGWSDVANGLIDDHHVELAEPMSLPSREQLQSIVDQAGVLAVDQLRSHKA